jgi:hypothetical protein
MGMNLRARMLRASAMFGIAAAIYFGSDYATDVADGQQRSSRRTTTAPAPKPVAKPTPKPAAQPAAKPSPTATNKPLTTKPTTSTVVQPPVPPQPKRETSDAAPKTVKPDAQPLPTVAPMLPKSEATAKPQAAKLDASAKPAATAKTPNSVPTLAPSAAPTMATPQPRTADLFAPPPLNGKMANNNKYLLRYQFSNGETVRWDVEHKAKVATTVEGASQTAETLTHSVKAWKVVETQPGGETVFVHSVESIDMRQKITGRQETRYNSVTDKEVPPMFQQAAKQVGVPLARLTMDSRGKVVKRVDGKTRAEGATLSDVTLVLPETPLGIGESWSTPFDMTATDKSGATKFIKARKKITLESVSGNIAMLKHETQILSPLTDPSIEAQVVQSEQTGKVQFDLGKGRIMSIEMSNDREVFGFQGDASVMHVTSTFSEKLTNSPAPPHADANPATAVEDKTAAKPDGATTK